jgi:hypothetical protein
MSQTMTTESNVVPFTFPKPMTDQIMAFKTIWTLNDIRKDAETGKPVLKASHYCVVLSGGSIPLWGVWTVTGNFVMYASGRSQIEKQYKSKTWKPIMGEWRLRDDGDYRNLEKRREAIAKHTGKEVKGWRE